MLKNLVNSGRFKVENTYSNLREFCIEYRSRSGNCFSFNLDGDNDISEVTMNSRNIGTAKQSVEWAEEFLNVLSALMYAAENGDLYSTVLKEYKNNTH